MRPSLSRSDLQVLLHEADIAARRLTRRFRLPYQDLADLRQEFLVDVIARLPAFDPGRGSLGAFAGVVMANRATRIANNVKRERLLYGSVPVSLDETVPNSGGATRGDLVAEHEGLAAYFGQPVDAFAEVERRLDVEHGLGILSANDGSFCAALSRTTVDRLAAGGLGARSSLYRRLKDIRLALAAAGVGAA